MRYSCLLAPMKSGFAIVLILAVSVLAYYFGSVSRTHSNATNSRELMSWALEGVQQRHDIESYRKLADATAALFNNCQTDKCDADDKEMILMGIKLLNDPRLSQLLNAK
jgi:hypothetical protein